MDNVVRTPLETIIKPKFSSYLADYHMSMALHHNLPFEILRSCGLTDKASDYESGDSRFESWQDRNENCFSERPNIVPDYLDL